MPQEPTPGRLDHHYFYWLAVNWLALAQANGGGAGVQTPDVTYQQNRLLKIIAQAVYSVGIPWLIQPASTGTDNYYLYNIATNLNTIVGSGNTVGPGRPDQVYAYIIDKILHGIVTGGSVTPIYAAPNQGDPFNVLLLKMDSLTYEILSGHIAL